MKLQRQEVVYQVRLGAINKPFAHPILAPRVAARRLAHAIAQYRALQPPAPLRRLHHAALSALEGELRAFRQGLAANGDPRRIADAEALDRRSRVQASRSLGRIATVVGACRADAAHC